MTSQYAAQVAGDLESNLKEQERVGADIAALQEQLATLQQDHAVLSNVQKALGVTSTAKASASSPRKTAKASAPSPRKRAGTTARKTAAKKGSGSSATAQPTLVSVIRDYLTAEGEPRSAAEITTALSERHPDRTIKTTVVRTTLEGLVARSHVQRTKQGSSVFYTAPEVSGTVTASPSAQEE
ncbi:hypothetical protein ACIQI8_08370 [Streptomyces sp. NPDC092369]|uniref:hypothetical protein n=1 Tax=Streptomyces sp. NPDC092369 TaxID=3366015 RepID=UPI0037FAB417